MTMTVSRPLDPASPAQVNFILSLLDQRDLPEADADRLRDRIMSGNLTKGLASESIGFLKAQPYKVVPEGTMGSAAQPVTEPGIYEHPDGRIFKVQRSKTSGHLYAKVMSLTVGEAKRLTASGAVVNFDYEYAPGAFRVIDARHRITGARAEELAVIFTKCFICNRGLKAASSVKAGIGPVCIKKV